MKNSLYKSSLKNNPKYREMLRRAARKFHLESLEDRRMFAIDPVLIAADGGLPFSSNPNSPTIRNESPRELTFTFPAVPGMDRTTLQSGIRLIGANKDGLFNANDITYTPAYLDLGNDPTQVVMRFASSLPDDTYRLIFVGAALKDTDGLPFNLGTDFQVDFRLNLAPQVLAVVPQPVVRDATTGTLTQLRDQVHVYLNNDDLDVARAEDEQYYRLLVTRGTVDPSDDAPSGLEITPTSAVYDPIKDKVVLTFSANIETFAPPGVGADTAVAYRLRIGTNEVRRPNVYGVTGGVGTTDWLTTDPGSTFDGAANLKDVLAKGLISQQTLEAFINNAANSTATHANVLSSGTSVIIGQSIDPQFYNLIWPGGNDDPGHRDVHSGNHAGAPVIIAQPPENRVETVIIGNDILENHLGTMFAQNPLFPPAAGPDQVNGVTTYYYNFRADIGYVPDSTVPGSIPNQPTFNVITERQKQRAREVLELIGQYAGVNFVETEQTGFIIATGDMRAIMTTVQTGAGGVTGLAGTVDLNNDGISETAAAIMDSGEDWSANGADLFGNAWFRTAMHQISEVIGLGHSYDLPALTVQGHDPDLSDNLPGAEPVFPGDGDIVHMQHVYRPESKDIDLYKFQLDQAGVFTAEVFAERLASSSQLDSALSIYRVNPTTQLPELYARNDDYFSKDAFIELELPAGTYYVGVSASGNIEYDPNVFDSGMGGTTQGAYQLKLDFRKVAQQTINDATGVALDGDSDGKPGGVNNTWFRAAAPVQNLSDLQNPTRTARTIFVDRLGGGDPLAADVSPAPGVPRDGDPDNLSYVPDGSLARPFLSIDRALEASRPFDIIRIVGNNLATSADTTDPDLADNLAYQIGFDRLGNPLPDGSTLDVPKDRTVVFDAGAVVQLRRAQISVGSENQGLSADRSGGSLQVFGTPWQSVYFTSFNRVNSSTTATEPQIGLVENFSGDLADEGDWGGIAFRNDIDQADGRFDLEDRGIFLNYISHADIRYGGGQVIVNSTPRTVNPIHLTDARPTIINNRITFNADAAMSANPDSFKESNFSSPQYGSTFNSSFNVDYNRVGPEIHGNVLLNNTVNALTIRSRTQSGTLNVGALEEMRVPGRFDDTDIVHVIQENLVMHSNPGGAMVHTQLTAPGTALTVAAPAAGTGGFAAGSQSQIEYKIVYVDENGNEGLASNTVKVTGAITGTNSFVRLTNLPNVTASLLAQGFVGRRLYRRVGLTNDFVLVEQIPASSSSTYIDRNVPLPASALRLKVSAATDSFSPRITGVTVTPSAAGGQFAAGQRVVYGLAWVDTEGRESPMVELPQTTSLGPNGSVQIANLQTPFGPYMGLRVYRSLAGGQFDLVGLVDANATSFTDTGAPIAQAQSVPATVDIVATQAVIPPPAGTNGFTNGQIVNYRFTYFGPGGETASSGLAVPAGETRGFVITGANRQITLTNLPIIDGKVFTSLQVYRSINYGRYELVDIVPVSAVPAFQRTTFIDTNPTNPLPTYLQDFTLAPPATARARPHGSLVIDPSIVIKSDGARIDAGIGTGIIAEGVKGRQIVVTSLYDQRYGAGGTFATSKSTQTLGAEGDWAGIYFAPDSKGSFNEVVFAYGGGENRIEGTFTGINVLEIQQAKVRVANSRFEFNASGVVGDQAPADRSGRGPNDDATIFVRGAQPVIIGNTVVTNKGPFISINANGLNSLQVFDHGRQTGLVAELPPGTPLTRISYPVSRLTDTQTAVTDVDNNGPLIRLNRLDENEINGLRVRGGVLTTEGVWDDTDIAHVLFDTILIPDFHTYGGLRLESGARESLVIKAANDVNAGRVAGFVAHGRPLETEDRIGGTLQVLGQPGFPVVMTAFSDDTISAGFTPAGRPQTNTNGDALVVPLPTVGEVANGLIIDNDVDTAINGHFAYEVGPAGSYVATAATAQGLVTPYVAQELLFDYYPVVYAGGMAVDLKGTVTVPPNLAGPDEVVSEGEFPGANGMVHWKSTSRFVNGSTRMTTSYEFTSVDPTLMLGDIRVISYLDQDVGALINDDVLYLHGSPGQADFRVLTLDNADRIGFAQGGIYTPGPGLTNAKYIGFGADKYDDLELGLLAGTFNNFAILPNDPNGVQNIDVADMPLRPDPALGNVWGLADVTTALAWDVSPNASSSVVTTFLELFPQSPVTAGRPGEWNGILIDKYANDRNIETIPEREPVTSNGSQNSRPSKAQFLGSLAGANKGGDENLRLGFVVQGAISTPSDVDIYSFKAKSETEVWFDIDRTSQALDSVIELVDEFGNVLARSDNSVDESLGADSLVGEGAYRLQKTAPYEGLDLYSTNVRDAGMRIKLPGPPGIESTYFVRVRSVPKNKADLDTSVPASVNESLVTRGVSFGAYELQVRLREKDEHGGTTVRYGRIANATTGIDVNGHPTHSPLAGERRDIEPNDAGSLAGAQYLGNLLNVDRGAISVGGRINSVGDVDWYRFTLDYTDIDGPLPVQKELPSLQSLVNTVFDLDYADGLGRPNLQLFVYNSDLELILTNRDSNVADDRSNALVGGAISDLGRGSVGFNDAYIGNIALPASTPMTAPQEYYVAVAAIGTTPTVLDQFTNPGSTNPLLRIEPIDSVHRIVEDHINEGMWPIPLRRNFKPEIPSSAPDRGTSSRPDQEILFDQVAGNNSVVPWHLGDVSMYVLTDNGPDSSQLMTFNPFTGAHMTYVNVLPTTPIPYDIRDIDFDQSRLLHGLTRDVENVYIEDANSGHLIRLSTADGTSVDLGDDGIVTYEPDPMGMPIVANLQPPGRLGYGIHYDAMSYFNPNNAPIQRILAVGRRGETYLPGNINPFVERKTNIVYQLEANGDALVDANAPRLTGAATDTYEVGEILTEKRFTAAEATNTLMTVPPLGGPIPPGGGPTDFPYVIPNITQTNYTSNILDNTQFTVTDGDATRTFEFDAGFDIRQTINVASDQTIRDGYFFILDADTVESIYPVDPLNPIPRNEVIFQYDTGEVIVVQPGITSTVIPDGTLFTVNVTFGSVGRTLVFEFDSNDELASATNIQIDLNRTFEPPAPPPPPLTASAIASKIADAINSMTSNTEFPVSAFVSPGSTRISLIPTITTPAVSTSTSGFSPELNGLVSVQGASGDAPVLQAVAAGLAGAPDDLEGDTFRLSFATNPNQFYTFEFNATGTVTPGNIEVPINYGMTSQQVADRMMVAIRGISAQTNVTADRYDDRVVVNGLGITYNFVPGSPIVDLMDSAANGGLSNRLINVEEYFTNNQVTTATTTAVNGQSQFSAGGEGANLSGRINFPPIYSGGKVATQRIDITGIPLWQDQSAMPGSTPGTIAIPFFAGDDAFTIANRVTAAIDAELLATANIDATANGRFVTLNQGQIILPTGSPFSVAGEGPGGNITGIVNIPSLNTNTSSTFVAVSDKGGLYEVTINWFNNENLRSEDPPDFYNPPKYNQVTVTYIGASASDLTGINFQGLSRGPAGVEGGRYTNTWFAVAEMNGQSRLYAFDYNATTDAYGGLQPIFVDGATNIPLMYRDDGGTLMPITNALGVRFSELQSNLWQMTPFNPGPLDHRQFDPGHGTTPNENGSRIESFGHSSFYFGTAGVGSTYDLNNGAYGTIISNEVNLEGYSAIDQPTLYFTYFSDHENALQDSLRMFVSGIADNNADRNGDGISDTNSGDWWPITFDDATVVPLVNVDNATTFVNVGVQPNFTSTGAWRQVRIPLDRFAGQQGLRFRLDFSTAGDMDVGTPYTTGEELRAVSGQFITDGQYVSIDGQIFEFNNGVSATFSSGRATPDGETIRVDGTGILGVGIFEFDKDNTTAPGNIRVPITDLMTPAEVATALKTTLTANGFGGTFNALADAIVNFHGAEDVTVAPAIPGNTPVTLLAGQVGLEQFNSIEIPFRRTDSRVTVANTLHTALERAFYDQKLIVDHGATYEDGQVFTLNSIAPALPSTATFEFDSGMIVSIPAAGANSAGSPFIADGDVFEVTWNGLTRRFEFQINGTAPVLPGNVQVLINDVDSQTAVANAMVNAINGTFGGMQSRVVSGSRIQLDTDTNAATVATFNDPFATGKFSTTGVAGVAFGNTPIYFTDSASFLSTAVATRVSAAINMGVIASLTATNSTNTPNRVTLVSPDDFAIDLTQINPVPAPAISIETIGTNNIKQYQDLIRLISSPGGPQHTVDIDPFTLLPYRGPLGWEAALPGDVADSPPGGQQLNGFRSNLRGANNAFEGIYVDDFVIGLAERGEMVTQVQNPTTATVTVPPLDPSVVGQVRTGDYQLEIRRGVGYDFVNLELPTFTPDSNDRFTAQQTLLARPGHQIIDGQTFTISDGVRQLTFEFNDVNQVAPFGVDVVQPGNQEISYSSSMEDFEVAVAIRDAINRVDVQQIISVDAWMGDGVQPGLFTTTNRVNLNGAATFVAAGVPVLERNESIATALEITAAGIPYDGLRFFANGTIGDSDDSVTSQLDEGRRNRDVDYFALDLVAGQQIIVDVDASILGSTLDSYLRIFNAAGALQNVTINGNTYTAENDGASIPMIAVAGGPQVTFRAPGEIGASTQTIGNTQGFRPDTDSALNFVAPVAGRYIIAVSGAGNNRYNPIDGSGAIPGSTGTYQLEITSPNAAGANSAGVNSAIDVITFNQEYGDRNLPRDQGQIILQGNEIYNSLLFGIDIDSGSRDPADGNAPHQGGVRNLSQANAVGLVPGVVVMNNVIYGNGAGGIRFSGDADPNADAPVPYGRIINNTLYGQGGRLNPPPTPVADVGILVENRAGPTMLNNILVNFDTAISVDTASRPNTVIGGIVTQGNRNLSFPTNIGFGDFPIQLTDARLADGSLRDPLFRNPTGGNFYLDALSKAIDSSVDSLLDRPLMVTIKAPLGLGESPIQSPDRDLKGQVRADDPDVQTPQGFGLNPFKDRGAIDRVDKTGPSSGLVNPQDNDSFGLDRDSTPNIVSTDNTVIVRNFTIALFDRTNPNGEPDGSDIDDFTVTTDQVIVTRRTTPTVEEVLDAGEDYFFSYDSTSNLIVITPVGNIWTRGTYRVYLNNGILDQAGNPLSLNNSVALPNPADVPPAGQPQDTIDHYYDIFLGTAVDYGDAPDTYPVLAADNGANHFVTPGVSLGNTPSADFDGKPSALASLDSDDGVQFTGNLLPGVSNGSSVTIISPTAGLKVSAWIDNDGIVGWNDTTERVLHNYVLDAGPNIVTFTIPDGQRGSTYARFRVSTEDINTATGAAVDGEVEDYQIVLTGPQFQNGDIIMVDVPNVGLVNRGFLDVNDDGRINAFDALQIINYLNLFGGGISLPISNPPPGLPQLLTPPPYLDTTGDGTLNSFDAIRVINHLNVVPLTAPPGAPESVSVGGGSTVGSGGEAIGAEEGAEANASLSLNLLIPETLYASSSILIETVPAPFAAAANDRDPVEELLDQAAMEAVLLAMAEREQGMEEVSLQDYQEVEVPAGPLSDDQWADLLDELALEQSLQQS